MKNKLINQIKAICQEEIDINNNPDTHFSKMSDGTEGICEGRLEFAEGLLDFINEAEDTSFIIVIERLLNQIKARCQAEIDDNKGEKHFSKLTDGTDGICEGRLEFAEGLLEFINESEELRSLVVFQLFIKGWGSKFKAENTNSREIGQRFFALDSEKNE